MSSASVRKKRKPRRNGVVVKPMPITACVARSRVGQGRVQQFHSARLSALRYCTTKCPLSCERQTIWPPTTMSKFVATFVPGSKYIRVDCAKACDPLTTTPAGGRNWATESGKRLLEKLSPVFGLIGTPAPGLPVISTNVERPVPTQVPDTNSITSPFTGSPPAVVAGTTNESGNAGRLAVASQTPGIFVTHRDLAKGIVVGTTFTGIGEEFVISTSPTTGTPPRILTGTGAESPFITCTGVDGLGFISGGADCALVKTELRSAALPTKACGPSSDLPCRFVAIYWQRSYRKCTRRARGPCPCSSRVGGVAEICSPYQLNTSNPTHPEVPPRLQASTGQRKREILFTTTHGEWRDGHRPDRHQGRGSGHYVAARELELSATTSSWRSPRKFPVSSRSHQHTDAAVAVDARWQPAAALAGKNAAPPSDEGRESR